MAKGDKLTPKQQMFVKEYLVSLNATQSAIKAGYSPKTACEQSSRLLANVKIQEAIQKGNDKRAEKLDISAEWVLNNLKTVAERCMQAEPVMVREGNEWVESGEFRFDSSGANKALEIIGKHLKLFTDKIEERSEQTLTINFNIPRPKKE